MNKREQSVNPEKIRIGSPIRVNFAPPLVPQVLSGEKFLTWRINDEKEFQLGDELILWLKGKDEYGKEVEGIAPFGRARVIKVWEKPFSEFGDEELTGHEKFSNREEMIARYQAYYGPEVSNDTLVKIIKFELL